nr:Ig-like domain repeat protein [Amycolatopsis rhizosphaerae]
MPGSGFWRLCWRCWRAWWRSRLPPLARCFHCPGSAWGYNHSGQLGNGSSGGNSAVPVNVSMPPGVRFTALAAGYSHSLALDSAGHVWAWGSNEDGQLGIGTSAYGDFRTTPVEVTALAGHTITTLAAGIFHSLVIEQPEVSTSTVVSSSASPASVGQPVTYTATVTSSVGTPVGTVGFSDNGFPILGCTEVRVSASGTAACTVTYATPGSHSVMADYRPAPGFFLPSQGTLTQEITAPTSHTTLSPSASSVGFGQPVILTATVTCTAGTPSGTVTFTEGATTLGSAPLTGGPATASLTVNGLAAGTHTIVARYSGGGLCPASKSDPVTVTGQPVTGTITGPLFVTKPTVPALGQQVTVTINVDAFATVAWRKVLRSKDHPGMLARRRLEVCVFSYLAAELRSGDIAVAGSDSYADLGAQLMAWDECAPLARPVLRAGRYPHRRGRARHVLSPPARHHRGASRCGLPGQQ